MQVSTICGQLKLYADDGKKYLADVVDETGTKKLILLLTGVLSKSKKELRALLKRWRPICAYEEG